MNKLLDFVFPYIGAIKVLVMLLAVGFLIASGVRLKHSYDKGIEDRVNGVWQTKEARVALAVQAKVATENEKLRVAQASLFQTRQAAESLAKELQDEKVQSSKYAADLASGAQRMRVLVRAVTARPTGGGQQTASAAPEPVDNHAYVVADIAPGPASAIEQLRSRENEAIKRLTGCIREYNAVKSAADSIQ